MPLLPRHVDPAADVQGWLEPAWAALQARHRDIPDCAFAPALKNGLERGFGAITPPGYVRTDGGETTDLTVMVFPGWLYADGSKAFEILMHEAVHALDYARNRRVSGHGEVFAAFARELGLEPIPVQRGSRANYDVRLTEALKVQYHDTINALSNRWTMLGAHQWVLD